MFIAAAGGVIVIAAMHTDSYSKYNKYNDSELRSRIARKQAEIESKQNQVYNQQNYVDDQERDVKKLRNRMYDDFQERVDELRQEEDYPGLDSGAYSIVDDVKANMRREIDEEIQYEQAQLNQINDIIAKINEIELQSKKR